MTTNPAPDHAADAEAGAHMDDDEKASLKDSLKIWGPVLLFVLIVFGITWSFVPPAPEKELTIATGGEAGAYFRFGNEYAEALKKDGFELSVRSTKGTGENLELLLDDESGVSVAMVQGGVAEADKHHEKLMSIASLYLEPLWVFYRADAPFDTLRDFAERPEGMAPRKLAIGAKGSGTRPIAELLLADNGVELSGDGPESVEIVDISGSTETAAALKAGEIDAAFFVTLASTKYVRDLLLDENVRLMEFSRAEAYARRYSYLKAVKLSRGMVSIEEDVPNHDIQLLAPTATMVARRDINEAIVPLLIEAARKSHEAGDMLSEPEVFPSGNYVDIPLSEDARKYFKNGPSFLAKVLPFWAASLVDRLKILLLPLLTLLLPLFKAAPPLIRFRIRRRIYRWYKILRAVDEKIREGAAPEAMRGDLERIKRMEQEVADVRVPLSYMEEFYNMRLHVDFVRRQLESLMQNG